MTRDVGPHQVAMGRRQAARPAIAALPAVALAMALTACGGAGVYVGSDGSGVAFSVNAFLDGTSTGRPAHPGEPMTVTIQAGQSIEFDASGAVVWRFSVNGGPFAPSGTTASAPGLGITVSPVGTSRVRVSTALTGGSAPPASVTLTATSGADQRDVATVQLQVR